ncbi:MAG: hypothetical protein ACK58L_04790, partial [Planctomycetota bacterium]
MRNSVRRISWESEQVVIWVVWNIASAHDTVMHPICSGMANVIGALWLHTKLFSAGGFFRRAFENMVNGHDAGFSADVGGDC